MVAILFLLMFITHNLMNSPTGRAMLAMKNSTSAAQAFGISLLKYRLLAFIISIVYAAVAGLLHDVAIMLAFMVILRRMSLSVSSVIFFSL